MQSPHCTWMGKCDFNDATKQECATSLCKAQGYSNGAFISSSNNFCTESHTSSSSYVYALKMSSSNAGRIFKWNSGKEAQITAQCISGMPISIAFSLEK